MSNERYVRLTVDKAEVLVRVNLDSDGTPLSLHGERMTEIEPGKWADPLVAEVIEFYGRHGSKEVTQ